MNGVAGDLWRQLLAEAWTALAEVTRPPPLPAAGPVFPAELELTGVPGYLPSPLAVEDTAIACAGAALLAASALHEQRGGPRPRSVRLDRGDVAVTFRSEAYLRVNGQQAGTGFAPLSRFWRAADGWVRTHANYPWHRDALLRALGATEDPESVAEAIASRNARDVENLVVGGDGVAAAVRSEDAWLAEPQGRAVAAQRLVEGGRIGAAAPRRRTAGTRPASGIRVLDLTRVISGPVCTRYLAALGADVLRLDPPHRPELPLHVLDGLPGKRSGLLDFGTAQGEATLRELLGRADVLVHGYRPHALDRFGLTPEALASRYPGLVVVSLSAWGASGPWAGRRGFDSIVQAASGIAMATSPDAGRPARLPCQLLDHGTGYLCAAAALSALTAQTAGGGTHIRELSLSRTAAWLLGQPRSASDGMPPPDPAGRFSVIASADGAVTLADPPGELDGTSLRWTRPLARYGGDQPRWLA
jgi:crotonobetainyl-CoA:carnitine CoA-transferase CaiB-like acyl-CoA transferase